MRAAAPNVRALTGVRAFAAVWVVLFHFRPDIKALFPWTEPLWPFFDAGHAGVDVFFVLSGFIISLNYLDDFSTVESKGYLRFLWLRLARFYPVHLFTLALFFLANLPGRGADIRLADAATQLGARDFWEQVFVVHAWGWWGNRGWNWPSWSISVEWFAYLLFPFAAQWLVKVRSLRAAWMGAALCMAFNVLSFELIDRAGMTRDILMVRIIGEFGAGAFIYLLWRERALSTWRWEWIAPAALIGGATLASVVEIYHPVGAVLAAPLYGLGILGLAHQRGTFAELLGSRAAVYAGEVSYALYMTHAAAQRVLWYLWPSARWVGRPLLARVGLMCGYGVLILAAAVLTYELVEKPARNRLRVLLGRRRAVAEAKPAIAG